MRQGYRLAALMAAAIAAAPAAAQQRTAVRNGFDPGAVDGKIILVMRPTVRVGAQSTGGMFEPNGDWTDRSRSHIDAALAAVQAKLGNRVVVAPDAYGDDARLTDEYASLFAAVARSVITYQFFVGNRLPTKKRDNKADVFDWSLGAGVAGLPGAKGADYALFIYNRDAYGSTGRKMLQVVAALGAGIAIKAGEHQGFAGLVDLRTGDILWLNADAEMGGDVRTAPGAQKRVGELLDDFPGSTLAKPGSDAAVAGAAR